MTFESGKIGKACGSFDEIFISYPNGSLTVASVRFKKTGEGALTVLNLQSVILIPGQCPDELDGVLAGIFWIVRY